MRRAPRGDGAAWVLLSALLCLGAVAVTGICAASDPSLPSATFASSAGALAAAPIARVLDWQAALGLREPWRLWTCAWVHGSAAHLAVNLAGGGVVAFVGWRARLPHAAAAAWFLAWPGTQLLMAAIGSGRLAAAMPHYFGLSGVLHAGVVVLGLSLVWPPARARLRGMASAAPTPGPPLAPGVDDRPGQERWIGAAILAGTLAKVTSEAPWDLVPRASEALGIAVAPVAHACGVSAGLLAWTGVRLLGGLGREADRARARRPGGLGR